MDISALDIHRFTIHPALTPHPKSSLFYNREQKYIEPVCTETQLWTKSSKAQSTHTHSFTSLTSLLKPSLFWRSTISADKLQSKKNKINSRHIHWKVFQHIYAGSSYSLKKKNQGIYTESLSTYLCCIKQTHTKKDHFRPMFTATSTSYWTNSIQSS